MYELCSQDACIKSAKQLKPTPTPRLSMINKKISWSSFPDASLIQFLRYSLFPASSRSISSSVASLYFWISRNCVRESLTTTCWTVYATPDTSSWSSHPTVLTDVSGTANSRIGCTGSVQCTDLFSHLRGGGLIPDLPTRINVEEEDDWKPHSHTRNSLKIKVFSWQLEWNLWNRNRRILSKCPRFLVEESQNGIFCSQYIYSPVDLGSLF